jgi:hypothetical protein
MKVIAIIDILKLISVIVIISNFFISSSFLNNLLKKLIKEKRYNILLLPHIYNYHFHNIRLFKRNFLTFR